MGMGMGIIIWMGMGIALLGFAQALLEKLPIAEEDTTLPHPYSHA
jgi:hypothetical protein